MSRTSRLIKPALPWAAATALLCVTAVSGTNVAWAQTATDLNCKKCVKKSEIDRKAVTKSKIKKGAVRLNNLSTALQDHIGGREGLLHNPRRRRFYGNDRQQRAADHLRPLPAQSAGRRWRVFRPARDRFDQQRGRAGLKPTMAAARLSRPVRKWSGEEQTIDPPGTPLFELLQDVFTVAPDGSVLALEGDSGATGINVFGPRLYRGRQRVPDFGHALTETMPL